MRPHLGAAGVAGGQVDGPPDARVAPDVDVAEDDRPRRDEGGRVDNVGTLLDSRVGAIDPCTTKISVLSSLARPRARGPSTGRLEVIHESEKYRIN